MGLEISNGYYKQKDFDDFNLKLDEETKYLKSLFDGNQFSDGDASFGIELEGWIVDENMLPSPSCNEFLEKLNEDQIVPEISRFNFEINSSPMDLQGDCFTDLHNELKGLWAKCVGAAKSTGTSPLLMGTLATLRKDMLKLDYISSQNRYSVMNEQILKFRDHKPFHIHIEGRDKLEFEMDSVLAECAATSLQIHLKVSQESAKSFYNASIIASPFMVAVSANSPYLLGKELWDESRIAIFQQSVSIPSYTSPKGNLIERVTLGEDYIQNSLFELFEQNQQKYHVLLPEISDDAVENMGHLMLHNGTIWRWNRPILGENKDGSRHLRIEHRTPSAGPTLSDSVANSLFYIGVVNYLIGLEVPAEDQLDFDENLSSFYKASRQSFYCKIKWIDGKEHDMQALLLNDIFPNARKALVDIGVSDHDIKKYMDDIMYERIRTGVNGARWQKAFVYKNGPRFQELLETYLKYAEQDIPVHKWGI